MLLLAPVVFGADAVWECPVITTPQDARPLIDGEFGPNRGVVTRVSGVAEAYVDALDPSCWVSCTYDENCQEAACATADGAWVEVAEAENDYDGAWRQIRVSPVGETWTSLSVSWWEDEATEDRAEWTGTLAEDLPVDGSFTAVTRSLNSYYSIGWSWSWESPTCSWGARWLDMDMTQTWDVTVQGTLVTVEDGECSGGWDTGVVAYVDDAYVGHVDLTTWEFLSVVDDDGDGVVAGDDCDDTDPGSNECASEIPYDGIDQDCDGTDSDDLDGDGHAASAVGGDDCDDLDATRYAGAPDPDGDGIDQDCDGRDDAVTLVAPGVPEPEERDDTAPSGAGPQAPGCRGGGVAWLLLLPALRRRRRARASGAGYTITS